MRRGTGGCIFAEDPRLDVDRARPIWTQRIDPAVLEAAARPATGPVCLDLRGFSGSVVAVGREEHLLLLAGGLSVRIDTVSGSVLGGPADLTVRIPLGEAFSSRLRALRLLMALVRGEPAPPDPDRRLIRLCLSLRARDGAACGASFREIGIALFGEAAGSEWPGDGEHWRSSVRRLVLLGRRLVAGGPGPVLGRTI